ncbi:hypothetical protein L7F22_067348 [Adiantum nelumboides]|nr:hypothetical protein [Adiantum nelumboides]
MDNYRGISLINVAFKIVITILVTRIARTLEMHGFCLKGQAGFRFHEECIGQVACLKELVIRQKNDGKPTYAVSVDFQKAYDSVPHKALFYKLDAAGWEGKLYALLKPSIATLKSASELVTVSLSPSKLKEGTAWVSRFTHPLQHIHQRCYE